MLFSCYQLSALAAVLVLSCSHTAQAHSAAPRPLRRLAHPDTLALEILPRQPSLHNDFSKRSIISPRSTTLRHDDSFRLTVAAFDDVFHLHLRPNEHLIHPAARIKYYKTLDDGTSVPSHTEPLLRESIKAYMGDVVPEHVTTARMREDAASVATTALPTLGWARIMVHSQGDASNGRAPIFEGAFSANGVVHHIMTKDNYLRTKHTLDPDVAVDIGDAGELVVWRDSDAMSPEEEEAAAQGSASRSSAPIAQSCSHDTLAYNADIMENAYAQRPLTSPSWYESLGFAPLGKRDDVVGNPMGTNFVNQINNTSGCPKSQKLLFMGVAADCKYVSQYGSRENATTRILTDWNTASSLYKMTFNVSLGIIELQVQDTACPSPVNPDTPWNVDCSSVTLDNRLSLFSDWRGRKGDDGVGLWHLMSGCPTGTEVGIAWLATLCQQASSGKPGSIVSGTAVSTSGRTEWQVIAHEIGHNFGAIHDCASGCNGTQNCCPLDPTTCNANAKFIMSPVAQVGEMNFSPCSLGNICSVMQGQGGSQTNTSCLVDPGTAPRQTISLQMCGNGIVEAGEQCDPGQNITSPCCDSATCKFTGGAKCDPLSSPCCTDQCGFAPTTQTCRPAKDAKCDTPETCSGTSAECPADVFSPNGQSCGSDDLKCASGVCTSLARQCQMLGASMNLKEACPNRNDDSCRVACKDPTQSNACVVLQAMLVDGSPCGYGGTCQTGKCNPGNLFDTAKAWYTQNLQIAIPITIVAGIVALFIIWALVAAIIRCCCGRRDRDIKPAVAVDPALARVRHQRLGSVDSGPFISQPGMSEPVSRSRPGMSGPPPSGPLPPPPASLQPGNQSSRSAHQRNSFQSRSIGGSADYSANSRSNWVDERTYNGPRQQW
ncbi:hypothetical protein HGRIS_014717 [Hohenbuehelia grisea]|uniref:Zinc metalloprotease n=1 Tax=Hohenbuehelia grisea TaxID=104357 RepID=A0ABR3IQF3_9AGAR